MRSLGELAWRNAARHPMRSGFTALAISLGVAMTLAADFVSAALLETLMNSNGGEMQVTHGFIVEQFDLLLGLVGYVLMGAAAFLAMNTFTMAVSQRRQEIGLLRALGMERRQVLGLVLVEALLTGGAGALLGLALGPLLGRGIVAVMQRFGGQFLAFGGGSIRPETVLVALALGAATSVIAALIPARRAARLAPLAALRPEREKTEERTGQREAVLGSSVILILLGALALAPPGEWLVAPANGIVTVLLVLLWLVGLGLLLPMALHLVGRAVRHWPRGRWATARLAGDNMQRKQGRVVITVLTLAVGLAVITGLTGFMTFAFNDLLGASIQRMADEGSWAVFPFDLGGGIAGLSEAEKLILPPDAVEKVMEETAGEASVAAFRFAMIPELSFLGRSYFSYVIDPETIRDNPAMFRFSEGDWDTAAPIMEMGCGVLVTPAVAQRNGAALGDEVVVTGTAGPLFCTVAGIGAGYANASIVGSSVAELVGATPPVGLAVTPRPGGDADRLEAALRGVERREPGLWVTRMADFANLQREAVELFGVSLNGLLLLAVLAAALGVVNTTMMNVYERRQELGLLRAVGATRRQVEWLVMSESALMGLMGGLLGVVAGMGSVVIIVTTFGGRSWGVPDLALWPAAWRALQPTFANGALGVLAAPLISALAARPALRDLMRGGAVEILRAEGPRG